jgi:Zn2+/Cd2+-exporting ATPase
MSTSTSCEGAKPQVRPTESGCSAASCVPLVQSEQDVAHMNTDQSQKRFRISNMDCASEESEIRRAVDSIPGIEALRFDLGARLLTISASQAALPDALQAIRKAGFKPEPIDEDANTPSVTPTAPATFLDIWGKLLAALGLALALAAEAIAYAFPATTWIKALGMGIALGAIFLSGFGVYGKGLTALRQGRLNINALMAVAVTGAFLIGQWPEAAMVMALYAIAEAIEARAVDRARGAIKSLLALSPEQAEVRQEDGGWLRIGVKSVALNSVVRISPGERVPLDGNVLAGQSAVDQSPLTGESLPVDKGPGDEVCRNHQPGLCSGSPGAVLMLKTLHKLKQVLTKTVLHLKVK